MLSEIHNRKALHFVEEVLKVKTTFSTFVACLFVACSNPRHEGACTGSSCERSVELNTCIQAGKTYELVYEKMTGDCGAVPTQTLRTSAKLTIPENCELEASNAGCKVNNIVVCTQDPLPGTDRTIDTVATTRFDWENMNLPGTYDVQAKLFSFGGELVDTCTGTYQLWIREVTEML